ncbi:hypothetical protein [Kocuria salsicia]|uniref:Uncharacterized protein n=1 Tax=Kocuria salsicia TaxID=664639 RepID=A0ABV3K8W1_9MICC
MVHDRDDEAETTSRSNVPVSFVDRAGPHLTDLSDEGYQIEASLDDTYVN